MGATIDIQSTIGEKAVRPDNRARQADSGVDSSNIDEKKSRRGRPKGARTTSLAAARKQAAEEKSQLKRELGKKLKNLQYELDCLQKKYDEDVDGLREEVEVLRRRESYYRQALDERLGEVADHLQKTLLDWGSAELEEAVIDKRGRGRPRKTLK